MHFRNIVLSFMLIIPGAQSLQAYAAALPTGPTNYPVGTLFNLYQVWQKPDGIKRTPAEAQAYCAASNVAGQSGWTVPSRLDLSNLYFDKGSTHLADNGWALDFVNTSSNTADGSYEVVSLVNGLTSISTAPALTTCVNWIGQSNFVNVGDLTFQKPDGVARNWPAAEALCAASTAGGLRGWRLPTSNEMASVYFENGAGSLTSLGWTNGWIWTVNSAPGGHEVVRMSDGARSYDRWSGVYNSTCVRDKNALAVPTLISGGLRWSKPDTTLRQWGAAATFCTGTIAGVTGWRLPTHQELSDLFYDKGWFNLSNASWTAGWVWTGTPLYNGHAVVQMGDGAPSYSVADSYATTCVRPVQVETYSTYNDGALTWAKPSLFARPIENAQNYCEFWGPQGRGGNVWRMPTEAEVQAFYTNRGNSFIQAAGFPASSNGLWTNTQVTQETYTDVEGNGERRFLSCVTDTATQADGLITDNGNQWDRTAPLVRPWVMAELYCKDKVIAGQTGWRMPSRLEMQALYAAKGSFAMQQAGWSLDWVWAFNPNSNGYQLVRMSDGAATWASTTATLQYATSCVRDPNGYGPGTMFNAGLAFTRPIPIPRPVGNMLNYCANATIAGLKGWRLPTVTELSSMVTAQTPAKLMDAGWPADYVWSSTPYQSGYQSVRASDGVVSWANGTDTNRSYVSCVR